MKHAYVSILLSMCVQVAAADVSADDIMLRKPRAATVSFFEELAASVPAQEKAAEAKPETPPEPASEKAAEDKKETPPEVLHEAEAEAQPEPVPEAVPEAKPELPPEVAPVKDPEAEEETPPGAATAEAKDAKPEKREAVITADRTDYDRKEGVVLFDRNVHVDDWQYQMHSDRLFLFLDGTNDLKRLVAIGHVAITNEDKRAYCAKASFNKKMGRVVMYSDNEITAELREEGKKGSDVRGEKIVFWLNSEQVEVENPVITVQGGVGGGEGIKKLLGK